MTNDGDDYWHDPHHADGKTMDEMLQEINKGIDEQINISMDIRDHLMAMDVRSEKYLIAGAISKAPGTLINYISTEFFFSARTVVTIVLFI